MNGPQASPARPTPAAAAVLRFGKLAAATLIVALLGGGAPHAATTYLTARQISDRGNRLGLLAVSLDFNTQPSSQTVGGGWLVVDGLLSGSRDRVKIVGTGFPDYIGRTFYAGLAPVKGQDHLNVQTISLLEWVEALDADGTLDTDLGIVFGEVRDAAGAPIAGASVTITPGAGEVFYFDDAGAPSTTLTETSTTGRYVILDVPPGNVAVNAAFLPGGPLGQSLGGGVGTLLGRAYGRVVKNQVTGLLLDPVESIGGTARDETGASVAGARIDWDFDTDFADFTDGAGVFAISGLAPGLDLTLRGSATGYRPALTFRRSR